ncbi:hypothetical protein [Neptunicella sp. SCSIO 80796]|uniref:hypothetical protein n=1 Tax=Neptunicella plasticusilytica TaxID=3117012 RepID=UPI003A4D3AD8
MIRLSRRGWNNVLIFACLFMILLFSTSNRILLQNEEQSQSQLLLPESSEIMAIDYGTHKIERIGRGWRSVPVLDMDESQLNDIASHWQQAIVAKPMSGQLAQPYIVTLWLAGQEQGSVYKLLPQGNDILVQHQQQLYLLTQHSLSDFIPEEIQ